MSKIIGIDIGGTTISMGVVENSEVIEKIEFPTPNNDSEEKVIHTIESGIKSLNYGKITGIGVGVPGLVDEDKGIVYDLYNIASWKEVHLKSVLEKQFKVPVKIANDANSFALGEKIYGKGKDYETFVTICLGTGLGAGIIINNKPYTGILSGAGELGGIPYLDKTIEDYCSGKFFQRYHSLDGNEFYRRAERGDVHALEIFETFGMHLSHVLRIAIDFISPEAIIFGGSVSKSFKFFAPHLKELVSQFPLNRVSNQVKIECSEKSDIAILGPAALLI